MVAGALRHGEVDPCELLLVVPEVLLDPLLALFLVASSDYVVASLFVAGPHVVGTAGGGIGNPVGPDDEFDEFYAELGFCFLAVGAGIVVRVVFILGVEVGGIVHGVVFGEVVGAFGAGGSIIIAFEFIAGSFRSAIYGAQGGFPGRACRTFALRPGSFRHSRRVLRVVFGAAAGVDGRLLRGGSLSRL